MSQFYMIVPPAPTPLTVMDKDTFVRSARFRWPGCRIVHRTDHDDQRADAYAYQVYGGYETEVSHFPDNQLICCDGPLEATGVAEVAAWARSVNPDPKLIPWLIEGDFSGHAILTPGITPDEIRASWVDHAEHDPFVEYPEYSGDGSYE